MRSYSVAVASLALEAPMKWTDNAISQNTIPGIVSARRGVSRRVTFPALTLLAVARELHLTLGMSVSSAIQLAIRHIDEAPAPVHLGLLELSVDLAALQARLDRRLADALESAPMPRRGRPPRASRT